MDLRTRVNGLAIWVDDQGEPSCSPGSREDAVPRIREFIENAEEWLQAVEDRQRAHEKRDLTSKAKARAAKRVMPPELADREVHEALVRLLREWHHRLGRPGRFSARAAVERWHAAYTSSDLRRSKRAKEWLRFASGEFDDF